MDRDAPPPATPTSVPIRGWKEHVVLPEWDLRLRGKLDTGARSSALHVTAFEELGGHLDEQTGERRELVRFDVVLGRRSAPVHHEVTVPIIGHKVVRDTGARAEIRPVVRTRIVCGPLDTMADITLTDRTGMNFRMLLGRLTLEHRALVDPSRGYLVTGRGRPRQMPR